MAIQGETKLYNPMYVHQLSYITEFLSDLRESVLWIGFKIHNLGGGAKMVED